MDENQNAQMSKCISSVNFNVLAIRKDTQHEKYMKTKE